MVETSYYLDMVVPEGMRQVSRRLDVSGCSIHGAISIPDYFLSAALLREQSHVPRALTEIIVSTQVRKTNRIHILYQIKKIGRKISHHISNKESRLFLVTNITPAMEITCLN